MLSGWPSAFFVFHLSSLRQGISYLLLLLVLSPVQVCDSFSTGIKITLILVRCRPGTPSDRWDALVNILVSCVLNSFRLNKASLSETVEEIGARMGIAFALSGTLKLISNYDSWSTYLRSRCTFLYEIAFILGYRASNLNHSATPISGALLTTDYHWEWV